MTYEEVSNLLEINGKESPVFMPNELFTDLQKYISDSSHIAFGYSYLYLMHFLYRNCKYFNTEELIDTYAIKQVLGYSRNNRTMNYIIKKDGLLDEIGYLESTKNCPLSWSYSENDNEDLTFYMRSDVDEDTANILPSISKMYFLKYPVKAFERVREIVTDDGAIEELEMEGTFYDVSYTHSVPFEVFMFCMANKDLGVVAFYLYSYIKHNNDVFDGGYDVPMTKLSEDTGIARRTMIKYMDQLKSYRMIDFQHNQDYFVVGMFDEDRKASTYYANGYELFSDKPQPFEKMETMLREDYLKEKEKEAESRKMINNKVYMDISELPY